MFLIFLKHKTYKCIESFGSRIAGNSPNFESNGGIDTVFVYKSV